MTRFIFYCIVPALFLHGCNKILEPVSLFASKQNTAAEVLQEEFEINI